MNAGTSVPAVQQAIVDLLAARTGLTGVAVTVGGPHNDSELQNDDGHYEAIWLGDVSYESIEPAFLGTPVVLDEVYTLDLTVQVLKIGDDAATQLEATQRAAELLADVVAAFAVTPDLGLSTDTGVTVFTVLPTGGGDMATGNWPGTADQHACRILLKVDVHSRLALT